LLFSFRFDYAHRHTGLFPNLFFPRIPNQVRNDKPHKLFTTAKKISINYKEHPHNKEEIAPGDMPENNFHKFVKIYTFYP
jgi:hypothetical protein